LHILFVDLENLAFRYQVFINLYNEIQNSIKSRKNSFLIFNRKTKRNSKILNNKKSNEYSIRHILNKKTFENSKKYSNRINLVRKTGKHNNTNPIKFIDKRSIMNFIKAVIQNKYANDINKTFIVFSDNGSNIYNHDLDTIIYLTKGLESMYIYTKWKIRN